MLRMGKYGKMKWCDGRGGEVYCGSLWWDTRTRSLLGGGLVCTPSTEHRARLERALILGKAIDRAAKVSLEFSNPASMPLTDSVPQEVKPRQSGHPPSDEQHQWQVVRINDTQNLQQCDTAARTDERPGGIMLCGQRNDGHTVVDNGEQGQIKLQQQLAAQIHLKELQRETNNVKLRSFAKFCSLGTWPY